MVKTNLPVILLKSLALLPHQEVRIEVSNDISKKVIDISKLYHDDEVLIVCPIDMLEENPDTSDLPKIGVIGRVKSKIELPSGNSRVVISGIKRVKVYSYVNYSNEDDVLESIVSPIKLEETDEIEETALLRKLIEELDKYIKNNAFVSNSILSQIKGITDLDKITDIIASFLPLNLEKKINLMLDASPISRAKYLIKEINIEIAILSLEEKIEDKLKNGLDNAQREFILKEKIKLIKEELGEENNKDIEIDSFRKKLKYFKGNIKIKEKLEKEIRRYELTSEASPEASVIRNYIDTIFSLPFSKTTKDETDIKKIEERLDKNHYGLNEIKTRIIEYIEVEKINKLENAPIICLVGPPGVGKTTFASSVANSIGRKFTKISLGGMNDTSELIGHRKTYIGSNPGKIINALIKCKQSNPIILLDEVDKLSKDYRGDPASTLLDVLDKSSNNKFVDNYIEEEVDLSKVFFILTANDKNNIPSALYDRLEVIELSGYTDLEKTFIATKYLIPKIIKGYGKRNIDINISDNDILYIINKYTKESGVRELERIFSKLIRKIIIENKKNKKEKSKIKINKALINKHLGVEKHNEEIQKEGKIGLVNGLAYTSVGGATIAIEVESFEGETKSIITGTLGDVMKESVDISLSYIKSHSKEFKIDLKSFENKTFHINVRQGGIPKDGPSAGVTLTTAIISHMLKKEVNNNISMTGEITLLGDILPIGGLKEKGVAACRNNIDTVFIPSSNIKDLEELEKEIKDKINFIPVSNYKEIYNHLFKN